MARAVSAFRKPDGTSSTSRSTGSVVDSIDGFLAAGGQYRGYTRSYNVTVPSNGLLWVVLRDRIDTTIDPYGMSISAIEIAGGGGIRCSSVRRHSCRTGWWARLPVSVHGQWWSAAVYASP